MDDLDRDGPFCTKVSCTVNSSHSPLAERFVNTILVVEQVSGAESFFLQLDLHGPGRNLGAPKAFFVLCEIVGRSYPTAHPAEITPSAAEMISRPAQSDQSL